jgi:hypothetical protein
VCQEQFVVFIPIKRGREDSDLRGSVVNMCGFQWKYLPWYSHCQIRALLFSGFSFERLCVLLSCCWLLKNAVRHRFLLVVLESAAVSLQLRQMLALAPFSWSVFPPACEAEAYSMVWSARAEASPRVPVCSSVRFCGPCLCYFGLQISCFHFQHC